MTENDRDPETDTDTESTDNDSATGPDTDEHREEPAGTPLTGSAAERDLQPAADHDYDEHATDAADDIVQFEAETSGVDAPGIADVPDAADEREAADYNPEDHPEEFSREEFADAVVGDPPLIEDDADDARLDPVGIDIDLPDTLGDVDPAAWHPDRRRRVREMLTHSNLPRGYHIRAYVNTLTGDIHEIVAAPDEGVVMDTPYVVSKREDAGKYIEPTLSPRERAAIYEVRFDPDEFVTDDDMELYEQAVRERHAERLAETAGVRDPMELPPTGHETYWAESAVEARRESGSESGQ